MWSIPLKQTLHINETLCFIVLKPRGPVANEISLLQLIEPLLWLKFAVFFIKCIWMVLKVKLL